MTTMTPYPVAPKDDDGHSAEATVAAAESPEAWDLLNQRRLLEAMAAVGGALDRHADPATSGAVGPPLQATGEPAEPSSDTLSALESLVVGFDLSTFERDVLVLAAGVELDADFARRCARARQDTGDGRPTFSLALACLEHPHWSALTPDAPLRRWRLVELDGESLTASPLRIDERILHYLLGLQSPDERLAGLVASFDGSGAEESLTEGQKAMARRLAATWSLRSQEPTPVVHLTGTRRRAVCAAGCNELGLELSILEATALPTDAAEIETFIRLWEREALLTGNVLLIDTEGLSAGDSQRHNVVHQILDRMLTLIVWVGDSSRWRSRRTRLRFEVPAATPQEQLDLWRRSLGPAATDLGPELEILAGQFRLEPKALREAFLRAETAAEGPLGERLWAASRAVARPRLEALARSIEPVAGWDDLVLPELQIGILRQIATHVRRRFEVYERWGFATKSRRGLGLAALFAGGSGTGKTLAAEVLATELGLDLYHIDLSSVISKYIGETEKNLKKIFDAAERGGALLLFDEADALFGKRSDVKDSHDRYANIEVSYLLQRMESYRGLSILTTNRKDALDSAFQRRLRFIVQFPFPDAALRADIWRRVFPAQTPTEDLQPELLARLDMTGGNIRNIALNAAFLASEARQPVRMEHLLEAARAEAAKLGKTLNEREIRGWTP